MKLINLELRINLACCQVPPRLEVMAFHINLACCPVPLRSTIEFLVDLASRPCPFLHGRVRMVHNRFDSPIDSPIFWFCLIHMFLLLSDKFSYSCVMVLTNAMCQRYIIELAMIIIRISLSLFKILLTISAWKIRINLM